MSANGRTSRRREVSIYQEDFVRWWREKVRVRHGGDRSSPPSVGLALKDAEEFTGVKNQQVSKCLRRRFGVPAIPSKGGSISACERVRTDGGNEKMVSSAGKARE
jgi:hypothetical protein